MYDYDRRRFSMEHSNEDALKKYLHEHPKADPKKHTVRKPTEEKGTSSSKAKGKGGPGKQRMDWVTNLKKDFKPKDYKQEDSLRHLQTAAREVDELEKKLESGDVTEAKLKQLGIKWKSYNTFLKETFGDQHGETKPTWELPKAQPKEPEKPKPEKSEKKEEKAEKKEPEKSKAKEPDRDKKKPKLKPDVEKKIEDKYGDIYEAHYNDWGDQGEDGEHSFSVELTSGEEVYVTVDSKTGDIIKMTK